MTALPTIIAALMICILSLPLLIIAGSIIIGIILALVNLQSVLFKEHRSATYRLYVLDRGWRVICAVVTQQFVRADRSAELWRDHAATVRYVAFTHLGPLKYPAWLIIAALHISARLHYLLAISVCILFMGVYTLVLLALSAVTLSGLIILTTLSGLGNLYARSNDFAYYCPHCYLKTYAPVFLCPVCKTAHPHLHPGLQGVLFHHCTHCQKRQPTLDLLGRRQLERVCPRCQSPFPTSLGSASTIHIALIGGIASGKTAYLVDGLSSQAGMKETVVNLRYSFIDPNQQQDFEHALQHLSNGEVLPATNDVTPRPIILRLRPLRTLLYLYDPAGKDFTSSERVLQHTYYKYTSGLLLIIDPFSIPNFYRCHEAAIKQFFPEQSMGEPDIDQLYARLMQAFEAHVGLHPGRPYRQSVAVVVTRADQIYLASDITMPTTQTLMRQQTRQREEAETQHQFVRRFLCQYGLENMLRDLETHFNHIHYFAHTAQLSVSEHENLTPYPQEALQWLLGTAQY